MTELLIENPVEVAFALFGLFVTAWMLGKGKGKR